MCNGRHPSRKHIASELIRLSEHKTHNDWTANNMIVQGNKLELIDWPSSDQLKEKGRTPTRKVVSRHKRFLKMSKQADVENFFWKKLL
jgi:tRNA A-37 threonylcarbamoyl transferase component Bud32